MNEIHHSIKKKFKLLFGNFIFLGKDFNTLT